MHGQEPEAGWYPNPDGEGLRWWDGSAWTSDLYVADDETMSAAARTWPSPAAGRRGPSTRVLALAATLVVVAVAVGTFLLLRSSGNDSPATSTASKSAPTTPGYKPPGKVTGPRGAFDAFAMERVHTAQIAIEKYATEHGGSYSGATSAILRSIEPTVPAGLGVVGAGPDHYSLTMISESGDRFTINKRADGTVAFTCAPSGRGGCPRDGTWE